MRARFGGLGVCCAHRPHKPIHLPCVAEGEATEDLVGERLGLFEADVSLVRVEVALEVFVQKLEDQVKPSRLLHNVAEAARPWNVGCRRKALRKGWRAWLGWLAGAQTEARRRNSGELKSLRRAAWRRLDEDGPTRVSGRWLWWHSHRWHTRTGPKLTSQCSGAGAP